jgi:RNA polymerase sporulation-specific sigma factor
VISIQTLKKTKNEDLFADYYSETNLERKEDIKNNIFRKNLGLARHIVKNYSNTGLPEDDLVSIASIGLLKGFNTFDPTKGWKFATYASTCMNNEILMVLRKENKHRNVTLLEDKISVDFDGNDLTLLDVVTDKSSYDIERQEKRDTIRQLIGIVREKFTDREFRIFENFMLAEDEGKLTQLELSNQLGLSQSYISRLEKRVGKKVRKLALSKGLIEAHEFDGEGIFKLPKAVKKPQEEQAEESIDEAPVTVYHISEIEKNEGAGSPMKPIQLEGKTMLDKVRYALEHYPTMEPRELADHLQTSIGTVRTYTSQIKRLKKGKIDLQEMVDKAVTKDVAQIVRTPIVTKDIAKEVIEATIEAHDKGISVEELHEKLPTTPLIKTLKINVDEEDAKAFRKTWLRVSDTECVPNAEVVVPPKRITPKKLELNLMDATGASVKQLIEALLYDVTEEDLYRLAIKIERTGE